MIRNLFSNAIEKNYENVSHIFDKTGNTKQYQTGFLLKNNNDDDHIRVSVQIGARSLKKQWLAW